MLPTRPGKNKRKYLARLAAKLSDRQQKYLDMIRGELSLIGGERMVPELAIDGALSSLPLNPNAVRTFSLCWLSGLSQSRKCSGSALISVS